MKYNKRFLVMLMVGIVLLAASLASARQIVLPPVNPANFVANVTNPYFPLPRGTTFIYEGSTRDGFEHVEDTVTFTAKVILGVTTTEVHDQVFLDGELVEDTFDWFAQDLQGNVWYFGEFTTELENGIPVSHEGSWEAGVNGALPGIAMLADPKRGDAYRQEFAEGVAEDMARVTGLEKSLCVTFGCFDEVLVTKEWTPLEPGFVGRKLYAPGVGLIFDTDLHGNAGSIQLVNIISE